MKYVKKGPKQGSMNKTKQELEEEIELLDTMITALVELLESKGILTQKE